MSSGDTAEDADEIDQPWHYQGPCPNCGKALALPHEGDTVRCVNCDVTAPREAVE